MKSLQRELLIEQDTAMSFKQISRILSGHAHGARFVFVDLETVPVQVPFTIDNMIGKHDCSCILLTVQAGRKKSRHWCTLVAPTKGHGYQFFDSLALSVSRLNHLLQDNGKFTTFLKKIRATMQLKALQKSLMRVKTCGLFTAVRCSQFKKTNQEFTRWITSVNGLTSDRVCVMLCYMGLYT